MNQWPKWQVPDVPRLWRDLYGNAANRPSQPSSGRAVHVAAVALPEAVEVIIPVPTQPDQAVVA
jgi:hypothetical protein